MIKDKILYIIVRILSIPSLLMSIIFSTVLILNNIITYPIKYFINKDFMNNKKILFKTKFINNINRL